MQVRSETESDCAGIEAVILAAFERVPHASHAEQFIVNQLRKAGQLSVSLVAMDDDNVIGHVAVSPVTISDGSAGWYGLGPISVAPEHQGRGIGTQLMKRALTELRGLGARGCVVLGDPAYYSRFGFEAEPQMVLPEVLSEYFQVAHVSGVLPTGTVSYHAAFMAKEA